MISITPGTRNSAARTSAIVENGADPILQFEKKYEYRRDIPHRMISAPPRIKRIFPIVSLLIFKTSVFKVATLIYIYHSMNILSI